MPAHSAGWPFAGRTAYLATVCAALDDPASAGVLLVGPPGVGKTRLLDAATRSLADDGRSCTRLVGAEATRHVPFASLAAGLSTELLGDGTDLDVVRVLLAVRQQHAAAPGRGGRAVLAVDDIALLDEATLAVVSQLVTTGAAVLLATMRDDVAPPPAVGSIERAAPIRRIEVGALDTTQTAEVLEAALGGPVEPATVHAIWTVTEGNPLFLQEVVRATLDRGALTLARDHWRLDGPVHTSARLAETVGERLAGLAPASRALCETVALAEPLRLDDLERAGWLADALALEDAGLVRGDGSGPDAVIRLAHPLYGEVLRAGLTGLRRRERLREVVEVVGAARRPDDELRVASWTIESGAPATAELLRRAAGRARAARDFVLTERFAAAATALGADLHTLALHGEALYSLGRVDEAERVLGEASSLTCDDHDRWFLVTLHHRILMWGTGEVDRSIELLRDALASMAPGVPQILTRVTLANALAFHDDPAGALVLLDELPPLVGDPDVDLLMGFVRSIAATRLGDPVAGARLAAQVPRATLPLDAPSNRPHPALVDLAHGFALAEEGDFATAAQVAEAGYRSVVAERDPQMHVWFPLLLARIELRRGQVRPARRWFTEASSKAAEIGFGTGLRMAAAGLAACAGMHADREAATAALADLAGFAPDIGFLAPETELGRAWALHALGRHDEALAALDQGIDQARHQGDHSLAHHLAYEALRMGGDVGLAGAMRDHRVTGRLAAARQQFADGLHHRSSAHLTAAETAFAAMGNSLAAAEAASQAAALLRAAGQPRDAAAAAGRARTHLVASGAVATRLVLDVADDQPLTEREREVAAMAAGGTSSKHIARELGLSVRTVSNHLQRAYTKLGVSTRAALADALEREPAG